jgi:hypothetical protein
LATAGTTLTRTRASRRSSKAEKQDILRRLFAQILIDAVHLMLVQMAVDDLVKLLRGLQICAEGFFDDHMPPRTILSHHPGIA